MPTRTGVVMCQTNAPVYYRLDPTRTVRQSLAAKTVIEFPTLLVVTAAELPRYAVVTPAQPPRPPASPHPAEEPRAEEDRQPADEAPPVDSGALRGVYRRHGAGAD